MAGVKIVHAPTTSNTAFFQRYGRPGRIGIIGGTRWVDHAVRQAQRPLVAKYRESFWSHVFLFEGSRIDGRQWIIESEKGFQKKFAHFGVQENHLARYGDEKLYPNVGVIDFGLTKTQVRRVLSEGLSLLASRTRYSFRELIGTFISMKPGSLRSKDNIYAQNEAYYCSAFVTQCYRSAGVQLVDNISVKNTTPEDIAQTAVAHTAYFLCREGVRPG